MPEISKTVDHALHLLILLGENGPSSPAELARAADLNRTVVHRLLTTLHERGFVTRTEDGYIPGTVLIRMAAQVYPELRAAAREAIAALATETTETVVMVVVDGGDAVVLDQAVTGTRLVRVNREVGSRHLLEHGAGGRALLAFLDPAAAEQVAHRQPDPSALRAELENIRLRGYAVSRDELQYGVHAVAVPVLGVDEWAVASLAVVVPATRATEMEQYLPALLAASSQISGELRSNAALGPELQRQASRLPA